MTSVAFEQTFFVGGCIAAVVAVFDGSLVVVRRSSFFFGGGDFRLFCIVSAAACVCLSRARLPRVFMLYACAACACVTLAGESVTANRSYLRIVFSSMERFDLVQKAGKEDAGLFEDDFDLALPTPPP